VFVFSVAIHSWYSTIWRRGTSSSKKNRDVEVDLGNYVDESFDKNDSHNRAEEVLEKLKAEHKRKKIRTASTETAQKEEANQMARTEDATSSQTDNHVPSQRYLTYTIHAESFVSFQ
jgi:hypothetical protein